VILGISAVGDETGDSQSVKSWENGDERDAKDEERLFQMRTLHLLRSLSLVVSPDPLLAVGYVPADV
jgi:hypothetical protein